MKNNDYSFIYLLLSKDGNKYKIGKANDVTSRYAVLKKYWGEFDVVNSLQIKCVKTEVYHLEKLLHFIFKDYHLQYNLSKEGYTEWFSAKSFKQAKNLIKQMLHYRNDLYIKVIEGVSLPIECKNSKQISTLKVRKKLTKTELKKRYIQKEKENLLFKRFQYFNEKYGSGNEKTENVFAEWVDVFVSDLLK